MNLHCKDTRNQIGLHSIRMNRKGLDSFKLHWKGLDSVWICPLLDWISLNFVELDWTWLHRIGLQTIGFIYNGRDSKTRMGSYWKTTDWIGLRASDYEQWTRLGLERIRLHWIRQWLKWIKWNLLGAKNQKESQANRGESERIPSQISSDDHRLFYL